MFLLRLTRIAAVVVLGSGLALFGTAGVSASSTPHSGPRAGGTAIEGGFLDATEDPAAGNFNTSITFGHDIFGSLFYPPATGSASYTTGSKVLPGLATSYSYGPKLDSLTIKIRHGLKFSDGTPLNAAAVAFNFNRYATTVNTQSLYFDDVSSVTTKGNYEVTMHFKTPDSIMIYILATTIGSLMASPTAVNAEGANFGLNPVGAGPFKVTSFSPANELVMVKNPLYYDAKHVYLNGVELLNTSTDNNVEYQDILTNAIQAVALPSASSLPQVLTAAKSNPIMKVTTGPNDFLQLLAVNTYTAPFNNQLAREAIDYCTDRAAIAKYVSGGTATPSYVLAGTSEFYFPSGGLRATAKSFPYLYDPAKGASIVKALPGGLSFTFISATGQGLTVATALAQQWATCGIKATLDPIAVGSQRSQDLVTGQYQMELAGGGGELNPGEFLLYEDPAISQDTHGYNIPTITNLINASLYTTNPTALANIWQRVWSLQDKAAVAIPIITGYNEYLVTKCLKGWYGFLAGINFDHAYYSCTP